MTAPVGFISPLTMDASKITSSTAVVRLASELDWNATSTYQVGTVVFRPVIGRRFENQIPGVNSSPPEDDQARWYDLGATDSMAMFDGEVSTQSIAPEALTVVFRPGPFNAIYIAGIRGQSIAITVKDAPGGAEIYSYSGSLEKSEPPDYYEHFFTNPRPRTDFVATGLTPFANSEATISINAPSGVAGCGIASLGDLVSLVGPPESGARMKTKSYSTYEADSRGKSTIKKGRKARDLTINITVPLDMADTLADSLDDVLDVPCAVLGSDSGTMRALRTFGLLDYELTFLAIEAKFNLSAKGSI